MPKNHYRRTNRKERREKIHRLLNEDTSSKCGAKVGVSCQGTNPLRKTCEKCVKLDKAMEIDYYPKTLKEARLMA